MEFSIEDWDALLRSEREALVRRLAKRLPSGFEFSSLGEFGYRNQRRDVALFRKEGATFALIPGAAVTLGWDPTRSWTPDPEELESWESTAEEYGIDRPLTKYIADVTLPPRRVELAPFLIETHAAEIGWEAVRN